MTCRDGLDDFILGVSRGGVPGVEASAIDAHVAMCESCRLSLALGRVAGPLPEIGAADEALAARLVERMLSPRAVSAPRAGLVVAPVPRGPRAGAVARRPSRVVPRWAALAAALVLTAGVASAALWTGKRWFGPRGEAPPVTGEATKTRHPRRMGVAAAPETPPASPPPPEAVAPAFAAPPAQPPVEAPPRAPARRGPARAPIGAPPAPLDVPPATETPETLLRSANEARRARHLDEAAHGYEALQRRFPASREATVSHLSLGNLALGRGQAAAALAEFEAYLTTGATDLEEEALLGKARALAGLGRGADERAAWQALEARHPSSPYLWRARQRLRELEERAAP